MINNDYLPKIEVDPERYIVKADGNIEHVSGKKSVVAARILDAVAEYFK